MVLPGFLATDRTTLGLQRALAGAGYRVSGWGLGMNRGVRPDTLERIAARLEEFAAGEPVILVGWSLGGIYARETAKLRPDWSPRSSPGHAFSGDRRKQVWRLTRRSPPPGRRLRSVGIGVKRRCTLAYGPGSTPDRPAAARGRRVSATGSRSSTAPLAMRSRPGLSKIVEAIAAFDPPPQDGRGPRGWRKVIYGRRGAPQPWPWRQKAPSRCSALR